MLRHSVSNRVKRFDPTHFIAIILPNKFVLKRKVQMLNLFLCELFSLLNVLYNDVLNSVLTNMIYISNDESSFLVINFHFNIIKIPNKGLVRGQRNNTKIYPTIVTKFLVQYAVMVLDDAIHIIFITVTFVR